MARSYFQTIAKMKSEEKFSREIKQNIQDYEKMLSDAIVDADLPLTVQKNIQRMDLAIAKAKSFHIEKTGCISLSSWCSNYAEMSPLFVIEADGRILKKFII